MIAANVVHATRDVGATLNNLKRLLAPHGLLVLVELTKRLRWVGILHTTSNWIPFSFILLDLALDITFGLLKDWWKFTDTNLRASHPMMTRQQWDHLLRDMGFYDVSCYVSEDNPNIDTAHSVIVCKAPALDWQNPTRDMMPYDIGGGAALFGDTELASWVPHKVMVKPSTSDKFSYDEQAKEFSIAPENKDHYLELFKHPVWRKSNCTDLVFLWTMSPFNEDDQDLVPQRTVSLLHSLLYLVQGLLSTVSRDAQTPKLWVVTKHAVSIHNSESASPCQCILLMTSTLFFALFLIHACMP